MPTIYDSDILNIPVEKQTSIVVILMGWFIIKEIKF